MSQAPLYLNVTLLTYNATRIDHQPMCWCTNLWHFERNPCRYGNTFPEMEVEVVYPISKGLIGTKFSNN